MQSRDLDSYIEVCHKSLLGEDYIGRVRLLFDDLLKSNTDSFWYRIGRNSGQRTHAGDISIEIRIPETSRAVVSPAYAQAQRYATFGSSENLSVGGVAGAGGGGAGVGDNAMGGYNPYYSDNMPAMNPHGPTLHQVFQPRLDSYGDVAQQTKPSFDYSLAAPLPTPPNSFQN